MDHFEGRSMKGFTGGDRIYAGEWMHGFYGYGSSRSSCGFTKALSALLRMKEDTSIKNALDEHIYMIKRKLIIERIESSTGKRYGVSDLRR